jgi:hypothetical protein
VFHSVQVRNDEASSQNKNNLTLSPFQLLKKIQAQSFKTFAKINFGEDIRKTGSQWVNTEMQGTLVG